MEFVAPKHFFFSFSFGFALKIKITSFWVIWNIAKNTGVSSVYSQPPVLWQGADSLSLAWGPCLAMGSNRSTAVPTSQLLPDWQWTQHVLGGWCKRWFFFRAEEDDLPQDQKSVTSSQGDELDGSICGGDTENMRAIHLSPVPWETEYTSAVPVVGIPWDPWAESLLKCWASTLQAVLHCY